MNTIKRIYAALFLLTLMVSCSKQSFDDTGFAEQAAAPSNLSALFDITQDNTGLVTITPNGEGVAYYQVYLGDGNTAPVKVLPGKNTRHTYTEGSYDVRILGVGINGLTTESTQTLTVSFKAPTDLEVTAVVDPANPFQVNLSAKANYETLFKVYFGDDEDEEPVSFLEGETISHIYATVGTYTIRVVALSGGVATTESEKSITIENPLLLPLDFEGPSGSYPFINFDGGEVTIIDNPQANGINTSAQVGKMVKNAGQPWGGSVISLGSPIDFTAGKIFRMKVFSPRAGAKVLLKTENISDGSISFEKEVTTSIANGWEDLTFDFTAINTANSYQKIVLIFELGTVGDGSANYTFLFDDIRLTNNLPGEKQQINLPVSFDDEAVNYTVTDFGNNSTIDGVDPTNSANKVKITTKPSGAETWAGTTIGTAKGFASVIPVTATSSRMSVRVYSPAADIPVLLKIEDHRDASISVETVSRTTVANAWETIVFDFKNHASGTPAFNIAAAYDKASIFFDFGSPGTGKVFYWDDVQVVSEGGTLLGLPLDFESSSLTYAFNDFDGGAVTVISNPEKSGINTSATVGRMIKNPGQPWGGSWIALSNAIDFSVKKTVKVKVFSPRAGAKLLLKVENQPDGNINFEKEVATTKAGEWEELTFDFSAINTANEYHKIVLIFDLGTAGDGSANFTYLFDDITLN